MSLTTIVERQRRFVGVDNDEGLSRLAGYEEMRGGIVELLETARRAAARSINALMTASYWEIGRRIVEREQGGKDRAVYGGRLIERLAKDLTRRFGRGFSRQNLQQMRAFYLIWSAIRIRQTVSGKLGGPSIAHATPAKLQSLTVIGAHFPLPWSAYVQLLSVTSEAARSFYEAEALRCG